MVSAAPYDASRVSAAVHTEGQRGRQALRHDLALAVDAREAPVGEADHGESAVLTTHSQAVGVAAIVALGAMGERMRS